MTLASRLKLRADIKRGECTVNQSGDTQVEWTLLHTAIPCSMEMHEKGSVTPAGWLVESSARAFFPAGTDIRAASCGAPPDRVTVGGESYFVKNINTVPHGGNRFVEALLVRLEVANG